MEHQNQMRLVLPSKSANEGLARICVSAFAAQLDPPLSELNELRTAVSEAVTNAIVHGYAQKMGDIYITAKFLKNNGVEVIVRDKGCGIEDIAQAMEPLYTRDTSGERSGMGFTVMESFSDVLKVASAPGKGTKITLKKYFTLKE